MIDRADSLMPVGIRYCTQGDHHFSGSVCPKGCVKPSEMPLGPAETAEAVVASRRGPSKPRPGAAAEAMLRKQLKDAGYIEWRDFVPQMAFALDLGRGWTADIGFPAQGLLCEVKGAAHLAGRKRLARDNDREAAAVALGYRVLPLNPSDVTTPAEGFKSVAHRKIEEALAAGELAPKETA